MATKVYYLRHHQRMRAVLGSLFRDASLRAVPSGSASPDRPSGEPGQMPPLLTLSSDQSSEQLHKRQSSGFTQEKVCSLGFFISYLYLCLVSLCSKEDVLLGSANVFGDGTEDDIQQL
jgi:hypothetical protein